MSGTTQLRSQIRLVAMAFLVVACSDTTGAGSTENTLTVNGSGSQAPSQSLLSAQVAADQSGSVLTGDPASMTIGMYALYISKQADCSAMELVQDYGSVAQDKDFMLNPLLFSGAPAPGAYKCVAFKISDDIRMRPATTFGGCVAGQEYSGDIYRDGESDWKDAYGATVVGHGTDEVAVDDRVTIFMARDPDAALARGISQHQLIELESDLVVPAHTTFYWDAAGSVATDGVHCGVQPGRPSFH